MNRTIAIFVSLLVLLAGCKEENQLDEKAEYIKRHGGETINLTSIAAEVTDADGRILYYADSHLWYVLDNNGEMTIAQIREDESFTTDKDRPWMREPKWEHGSDLQMITATKGGRVIVLDIGYQRVVVADAEGKPVAKRIRIAK